MYFGLAAGTLACFLLLCPAELRSEELLTLEQALGIAQKNNPQLGLSQQDVDIANAGTTKAKAYPNPELDIAVGGLPHREAGATDITYDELILGGEVSQEVELWGTRSLRKEAAQKVLAIAKTEKRRTLQEVTYQVKQGYYSLLLLQRFLQIAQENLENGKRFLGTTELKHRQNDAPLSDVLRARLELVGLRSELVEHEQDLQLGKYSFNVILGRSPDADFQLKDALEYQDFQRPIEQLLDQAKKQRPELEAATLQVERQQTLQKLFKRKRMPNPTFKLWGEKDGPETDLGAGLQFPLPFWNRQQGEIQEAKAQQTKATLEQAYLALQIDREVKDAFGQMKKTAKTLVVRREGIETAAELLRNRFQSYQEGRTSFLILLETLQSVNEFREAYYTSLVKWHVDLAALEKVIGSEL